MLNAKNITIAVLASVILGYAAFVGFSLFYKVAPDPQGPELVLNKKLFEIGDQIQVAVKHNRTGVKYTVNWNVLDGYNWKNDYTSQSADSISMGTGKVNKTFLVIVNVNYLIDGEIKSYNLATQVIVGNGPNPPNPPTPPDPPLPPPSPAPIPVAGFRVLIVEEQEDRSKLTAGQREFLFGAKSRDWLDANCIKENGQPGYRIYDKNAPVGADAKLWQDAMARPRTGLPSILISNGTTGFEGPMPATLQEIETLVQKYLK